LQKGQHMITMEALRTILADQREEIKSIDLNSLYAREEESSIDLESPLAQIVIGVRRSGKSTLCTKVLKQSGIMFAYVNFDDERLSMITVDDLNTVLEATYIVYGKFTHLFLDEVQNVDGWHLFVNRLLRTGMHLVITGSNAKLLSGELATHLTGRCHTIELFPLSFSEYCLSMGINTRSETTTARAAIKKSLLEYLGQGGFPELKYFKQPGRYTTELKNAIISRDILTRFQIRNPKSMHDLANLLIGQYCQEINTPAIARELGVKSIITISKYLSYLGQAYLILEISRFSFKSRQRIGKSKAYLVDPGFATTEGQNGWRLENTIYIELLRRSNRNDTEVYYYKNTDHRFEIDFVVSKGNVPIELIQVSYDVSKPATMKREVGGLIKASKFLRCNNLTLITFDEKAQLDVDGTSITMITAHEWLLGAKTHLGIDRKSHP
jgi:hypothetical protein